MGPLRRLNCPIHTLHYDGMNGVIHDDLQSLSVSGRREQEERWERHKSRKPLESHTVTSINYGGPDLPMPAAMSCFSATAAAFAGSSARARSTFCCAAPGLLSAKSRRARTKYASAEGASRTAAWASRRAPDLF